MLPVQYQKGLLQGESDVVGGKKEDKEEALVGDE